MLGLLKFSLDGNWKNPSDSSHSVEDMEEWASFAWRLKGSILIAYINQDLLYLEFTSLVEGEEGARRKEVFQRRNASLKK